jgi:hypothetical protein
VSTIPGRKPTHLSPVAVTVRYAPTMSTSAAMRLEHDVSGAGLQSVTASGSVYMGMHTVGASLSRRRIYPTTPADTFLSGSTTLAFLQNRVRGSYNMNWDVGRNTLVSQLLSAAYFAQCCGFGVEFQNYNYPQISSSYPIPADRRINFSFTLAGLGTFSNFFGAFGGTQR